MKQLINLLFFSLLSMTLHGADYYWVNGTGDWSDAANHWATAPGGIIFHAEAPGPDDDVHFDEHSFTGPGQVITVDMNPATCLNMDWSDVTNTPTLRIATTGILDIYGNLLLVEDMQLDFVFQFGSRIRMQADDTGHTVTTAGQDMVNFRFEGSGEWTLEDALNSSSEIIISDGSLISDGFPINANNFITNGSNVDLDLRNSVITVAEFRINSISTLQMTNSAITAGDLFVFGTGYAFDAVELIGSRPSLSATGLTFETLVLSGTEQTEITGSQTINNVLRAGQSGSLIEIRAGSTITLNGALESLGGDCADRITWRSDNAGTAFTFSKASGNVMLDFVILQDVHALGGATFTADNSVDLGNTTGWTINAPLPQTYFWIADAGGDWSDSNNWGTSTGGAPNGCIPGPADDVVFDINSFNTAASQPIVRVDGGLQQAASMRWDGVLNNPQLLIPTFTRLELYGDLKLAAAMELEAGAEASSQIWMKGSGPLEIESAGIDLVNLRLDGPAATFTLQDPLTSSYELFITEGLLDLDEHDLNSRIIVLNGNQAGLDMTNARVTTEHRFSISSYSSFLATGSTLTTNHLAASAPASVFDAVTIDGSNGAISGNGITMSELTIQSSGTTMISGSHTVTGLLLLANAGDVLNVQAGAVLSIGDFRTKAGSCGNEIYLRSSSPGQVFTFLFTGPTPPNANDIANLIIQDSQVDNGPFETNSSTDLGNTPGWVINSTASQTFYWIGGTGSWDDTAHWSLSSGGGTANCVPGVNDDVIFDRLSFSLADQIVTVPRGAHYCRSMEWVSAGPDAVAHQPTLEIGTLASLYVHGNLLLADPSLMTYQTTSEFSSTLYMAAREGEWQIRSSGHDLLNFRLHGEGGSWALLDNLRVSSEFFLSYGQLKTSGFDIEGDLFVMNNGTMLSLSDSRLSFNTTRLSSNLIDRGTSILTTNILESFAGGLTLYDVILNQAEARLTTFTLTVNELQLAAPDQTTVDGNITVLSDLTFDHPGSTVIFGAGNTIALQGDLICNAVPGDRISLQSDTPGLQTTLQKSSGAVCIENMNIQDCNAGGGAVFGAVNSTDLGNNSGWIFSPLPSCGTFLPVECADFRAEPVASGVQLQWSTWSEKNNLGFELQRSAEDGTFTTIAWIAGAEDSNELLTYRFFDENLPTAGGTYYYRLLQKDVDGQTQQACNTVSATLDRIADEMFKVYPNPASETATVSWIQATDGAVMLTVFDALGRVCLRQTTERSAGRQAWSLDLADLPKGYHSLRLQLPDRRVRFIPLIVNRSD